MNSRLELILKNERGEVITQVFWDVDKRDTDNPISIPKPCKITGTMDQLIHQMEAKDHRKVNFRSIGSRLGALLADRLSDLEGWHGEKRRGCTEK